MGIQNIVNSGYRSFLIGRSDGITDLAERTMGDQCHIIGETAWRSHPGYNGWTPHTDQVWITVPESDFEDPKFLLPITV